MQRVVNAGQGDTKFERAALGLDDWRERVMAFGFGTNLGGTVAWNFDRQCPEQRILRWHLREATLGFWHHLLHCHRGGRVVDHPLQMANLAATLANRGWYRLPHFIHAVGDEGKPLWIGHAHGDWRGRRPF